MSPSSPRARWQLPRQTPPIRRAFHTSAAGENTLSIRRVVDNLAQAQSFLEHGIHFIFIPTLAARYGEAKRL